LRLDARSLSQNFSISKHEASVQSAASHRTTTTSLLEATALNCPEISSKSPNQSPVAKVANGLSAPSSLKRTLPETTKNCFWDYCRPNLFPKSVATSLGFFEFDLLFRIQKALGRFVPPPSSWMHQKQVLSHLKLDDHCLDFRC